MKITTTVDWYFSEQIGFSKHTRRDYGLTFRRLCEFVGPDTDIEKLTRRDINLFLAHLENDLELGPKTLANAWAAMSSLWSWAERELQIPHIIRGKVKRPAFKKPPVQIYTRDEVKELIVACKTYTYLDTRSGRWVTAEMNETIAQRNETIIRVLLDSGLRREELVSLTIADYNADTGQLIVRHGKGDKARIALVGKQTRKSLYKYLGIRKGVKPTDRLFVSLDGKRVSGNAVRLMFERLGSRAGVAGAGAHRCRHTFATRFLVNGGTEKALRLLLGHETIEMTHRYVELAEAELESAHEVASPMDNWRI